MALVAMFPAAAPAQAAPNTAEVGSNGELLYEAAQGQSNDVQVSETGGVVTVRDTGALAVIPGQGCVATADAQAVACTGADKLNVFVRDLNDTVTVTAGLTSEIRGQFGDDTLTGGTGKDILRGGDGNDFLSGGAGQDVLIGDGGGTEIGDDQLIGGEGVDTASYAGVQGDGAPGTGATVDLGNSSPQDTRSGMDTLTAIESVHGSTTGGDVLAGAGGPNTLIGSGGDDVFSVMEGGVDTVNCGAGTDEVYLDQSDIPRFWFDPAVGTTCETLEDFVEPTTTTITSGPEGLTNDPTWTFESEQTRWVQFDCTFVRPEVDPGTGEWFPCRSGQRTSPPSDGDWVFAVRAIDGEVQAQFDSVSFALDVTAPETVVSGPTGTISDTTPEFTFSSPDDPNAKFLCNFDRTFFFYCTSPVTPDPPLSDGDHLLEVVAEDALRNRDATPAQISFRIDTSTPGATAEPPAPAPQAKQSKIIIGSLVLISGATVKMSRKGRVSIQLTCAGSATCKGRLSITTAEPASKRSRKLVTLGTKRFTIPGNKKRKVHVRFSKSKIRLAKKLKRFKAKAVIREIDARGNLRLSSRTFILRAR